VQRCVHRPSAREGRCDLLMSLAAVSAATLTPQRAWLERLAIVIPSPTASRWLLLADAVCLIALGLRTRHPVLGVLLAFGAGFLVLNVLGMGFTDFYLGLAAFHFLTAAITLTFIPHRWLGATALALTLLLAVAT
jgi:hypothetical protein